MDMKVESIDACRAKVSVEIPAERVDKEIEAAFARLANTARVAGFRPGKAPRNVLELHYGAQVREEVKEKLVDESFSEALRQKKVEPAVVPQVNTKTLSLSSGGPFRYDVDIEVWPEFRLGGYTGIKASRKKAVVKDEDAERYLQALREQHAEFTPVDGRPIGMGDYALMDIAITLGETPLDERKGVWLEMAPDTYAPGFCEKLIGMKAGEERAFSLPFPSDAREELRGKEGSFRIALKEIKQKKLPLLDDEFCKELGSYKNVDELRAAVRADILKYAESQEEKNVVDQINDYLLAHNEMPLPPTRVNVEAAALARKTAERLLSQGVGKEEILKKKEELMAAARKEAEKMIRLSCIYDKITEREGVAVSAEEIEARVKRIAESMKREPAQVRAALEREGTLGAIEDDIKREKVVALLLSHAKIKEVKE